MSKGIEQIPRTIMTNEKDIKTLTFYALASHSLSFKKYAEKLLADKANEIRKKQKK